MYSKWEHSQYANSESAPLAGNIFDAPAAQMPHKHNSGNRNCDKVSRDCDQIAKQTQKHRGTFGIGLHVPDDGALQDR